MTTTAEENIKQLSHNKLDYSNEWIFVGRIDNKKIRNNYTREVAEIINCNYENCICQRIVIGKNYFYNFVTKKGIVVGDGCIYSLGLKQHTKKRRDFIRKQIKKSVDNDTGERLKKEKGQITDLFQYSKYILKDIKRIFCLDIKKSRYSLLHLVYLKIRAAAFWSRVKHLDKKDKSKKVFRDIYNEINKKLIKHITKQIKDGNCRELIKTANCIAMKDPFYKKEVRRKIYEIRKELYK